MNQRFNMLPARYVERMAERRLAGITAVALVTLLMLLALAGLNQGRVLSQAEDRRDAEQARANVLTARRAQLVRFRQLADAIVARERLLTSAMGTEISWATVLTSLALAFPADASLTSVNLRTKLPAFGAPPVTAGDERSVIGSSGLKGYSVTAFTPGVDRLLQLLTAVTGLSEPRLQAGTREELGRRPVTTFEGSAFVDAGALTGRYARGLPPEDDLEVPAVGAGPPGAATAAAPK
ncbi:MAG: hypothetical protein ACRD1D_07410 [Acidimicrobiales bacterium]